MRQEAVRCSPPLHYPWVSPRTDMSRNSRFLLLTTLSKTRLSFIKGTMNRVKKDMMNEADIGMKNGVEALMIIGSTKATTRGVIKRMTGDMTREMIVCMIGAVVGHIVSGIMGSRMERMIGVVGDLIRNVVRLIIRATIWGLTTGMVGDMREEGEG
jgi:hypothetical protein